MDCRTFRESLVGRVYGENAPRDDEALDLHVASCDSCRDQLEALGRVRAVLRADEPEVPLIPRVVVLGGRSRLRPAVLAASILGAAILAGAAAGGGYAIGRGAGRVAGPADGAAASPAEATPASQRLDPATENAIRDEVARRVGALAANLKQGDRRPVTPESTSEVRPVTAAELDAAMTRLERKVGGARAADLDYVLTQLAASEVRTGRRIGQTNEALRYVALASNPNVSEQ
jgi:hypothetical protein